MTHPKRLTDAELMAEAYNAERIAGTNYIMFLSGCATRAEYEALEAEIHHEIEVFRRFAYADHFDQTPA